MPPIINAQEISKSFGANPLFQNISFTVSEGDRIGLIGPNGSGKSTLLRILAGDVSPDSGEIAVRKRIRLSYIDQDSTFKPEDTIRSVAQNAMERASLPESERGTRFAETLGRAGFEDLEAKAFSLSGGWRKRLAVVEAVVQGPDILLLDEPTNHLDLAGIEWLEELLEAAPFACVVVSHDRYFLENVATDMAELNRTYPDGVLRVRGSYSYFLEKKEEFLHARSKRQEALENLVHREIEWLRRGAKARTRKSKARIDKAGELMGELADLNARSRTGTALIDFSATDRKTKRLIELENVSCEVGGRCLIYRAEFGHYGGHTGWASWAKRQREDELAAAAARRNQNRLVGRRFGEPTGCACVLFRPDPRTRSRRDLAPGAGTGRRFGDLPGSVGSRGFMGREVSVPGASN